MRAAFLAAFLLLSPLVLAGSSQSPEATDPAGDVAQPWADMFAAWFEMVDGDLVVRWRVASLANVPDNACWNLDFHVGSVLHVLYASASNGGTVAQRTNDLDHTVSRLHTKNDTLTAVYDAALFPVRDGQTVAFRAGSLYSCEGNAGTPRDRMDPGKAYVVSGATFVPVPSGALYRGAFLAATPLTILTDACADPAHEGLDSSCVALGPRDGGNKFTLHGRTGPAPAAVSACFYQGKLLYRCDAPVVPRHATHAAVYSLAGAAVEWELRVA